MIMRFLSKYLQKILVSFLIQVCRTAYLEMCKSGIIRPILTEKPTTQLVCSHSLDYCSFLLVQNNAAKLVLKKKHRDLSTPLLKNDTGFLSQTKNRFQNCNTSFRHSNNTLSTRLTAYTPSRSFRSCFAQLLSALG